MNAESRIRRLLVILLAASLLVVPGASAQEQAPQRAPGSTRWEAWLGMPVWPSLKELQPAAGGSFNSIGYGLGATMHWRVKQLDSGELMLGVEGAIMATNSDVPASTDDVLAPHAYVAVSTKWVMGQPRNLSLDAGLAYHIVDIAQFANTYRGPAELVSWEGTAAGIFVAASWDVGADRPGKNCGLSLGLKVHFVDFGGVRDEHIFSAPVLGANAGDLNGPIYILQVGYRSR